MERTRTSRTRSRAEQAVQKLMIDAIRRDTYPSATMMRLVEGQLSEEELPAYLDVLLDKVEHDRYPSVDMLRHIVVLNHCPPGRFEHDGRTP